ncbi:MAG: hypothetical protein OHK0045_03000 [Raineya sp.]
MEKIKSASPLVSVVMPVYNAEKFLAEAIESILNQTFTDFEFLIFNDGSTDNSLKIIQQYQRKDSRIKLVYNGENKGYVFHLNEGIRLSKGKYIARMDADDIALPERFTKQVSFLEANPEYVLCGSLVRMIGKQNHVLHLPSEDVDIRLKMLYINPFAHPSVMMRKETLIKHSIYYNEAAMPAEDYVMWVNLLECGKVCNLKEILLQYRVHENNISYKNSTDTALEEIKSSRITYIKKIFKSNNLSEEDYLSLYQLFSNQELKLDEIEKIANIINKIIENDMNYMQQANTKDVKNLLVYRFYYVCTTSTHLGLPVWRIYEKSGLMHPSKILNLKFLIKALLKYDARTQSLF